MILLLAFSKVKGSTFARSILLLFKAVKEDVGVRQGHVETSTTIYLMLFQTQPDHQLVFQSLLWI